MLRGGAGTAAWLLLSNLMTDVLSASEWLKLWDHAFTMGPDFLPYAALSYLTHFRGPLLAARSPQDAVAYLVSPRGADINKVIRCGPSAAAMSRQASYCALLFEFDAAVPVVVGSGGKAFVR